MFCLSSRIIRVQLSFNVNLCFLQAAQASIAVGSQVWVEDPDVAWIDGEVVKVNGDTVTVKCSNEKTVCCFFGKFRVSANARLVKGKRLRRAAPKLRQPSIIGKTLNSFEWHAH